MTIRRATISDVATLVDLNRSTQAMHAAAEPDMFRADPPDDVVAAAFRSSIETSSSLWLIAEEGRACGYLSADFREIPESWCHIRHQVCYIAAIAVDPAFRRKGIARALLSRLKAEAAARGVQRIELSVFAFNVEAKKAFEGLGFRTLIERKVL